jgi:organic radical activating enzyme
LVFSSFRLSRTFSSPRQGLQGFRTTRPPVPEDTTAREVCWLAAEEKKRKKDEEKKRKKDEEKKRKKDEAKKRACKRMVARDSLKKRSRAQAREGLPLEASPSTEEEEDDDDDDEGMEVRAGFSPKVGPGPRQPR